MLGNKYNIYKMGFLRLFFRVFVFKDNKLKLFILRHKHCKSGLYYEKLWEKQMVVVTVDGLRGGGYFLN